MSGLERLPAAGWAELLLDAGTAAVTSDAPAIHDPLAWPGYADRVAAEPDEALVVFDGRCGGHPVVLAAFDFTVLGGSMGTEVGRRLRAGYDRARALAVPVVVLSCTGGARMQEGMRSLVQMPAVVAAALDHAAAGLLQIAIAAHPTTGGVHASAVGVADVVVTEPGAYMSFAGPRVAAALGDAASSARADGGSAGALAAAGQVDAVVPREELAGWLARVLAVAAPDDPVLAPTGVSGGPSGGRASRHTGWDDVPPFDGSAWEAVEAARAPARPGADAILEGLDGLVPLVGDRAGGSDPHTTVALARLGGRRFVVVAQDHGPVEPAGYRTAQRGMALAERLGIPLVTLIDTHGAAVGAAADDAGQAGEIARTLRCLLGLAVPTLGVVVGEGGSGGAIALAAVDLLAVQRTATFSVIAPEGAAAILHRDPDRAAEVADRLGLRSADLVRLGIADLVVDDDPGGTLAVIDRWLADPGRADPPGRRARWRRVADGDEPPHADRPAPQIPPP